ncbi:hypothetical protein [Streptomyces griseoruber]|uniref:Uncharacterized protein n=1 Tax=Streptomyces griseoruber TaxID=1943 RepID=A0A117RCQ8_9ACTN|nr:hypothetical protein [Streptomyces griseoruber]KUN83670.1 hypothetical protein AQJ64_17015 [Streptomyces griseoruber]
MTASYTKQDPNCRSEILFIGTTGLRKFVTPPPKPANLDAEMYIDVIVPAAYKNVEFTEICLTLEVKGPTGAKFMPNPRMGSGVRWGVPISGSTAWDETSLSPTPRVRLRLPHGKLLSGGINGLSFWLGVSGLPTTSTFSFTAAATADQVLASTTSCPLSFKNFAVGEQFSGYLGRD